MRIVPLALAVTGLGLIACRSDSKKNNADGSTDTPGGVVKIQDVQSDNMMPGTAVSPTALVKTRLVKATTADQLPETSGALAGSALFKNAPMAGREFSP